MFTKIFYTRQILLRFLFQTMKDFNSKGEMIVYRCYVHLVLKAILIVVSELGMISYVYHICHLVWLQEYSFNSNEGCILGCLV